MAIVMKSLASGQLSSGSAVNLYPPGSGTASLAVLVKSMRFVNRSTSAGGTLTLSLKHGSVTTQIGPTSIAIPPNGLYIESEEIALGVGDAILGAGSELDYVISGVEREVP